MEDWRSPCLIGVQAAVGRSCGTIMCHMQPGDPNFFTGKIPFARDLAGDCHNAVNGTVLPLDAPSPTSDASLCELAG